MAGTQRGIIVPQLFVSNRRLGTFCNGSNYVSNDAAAYLPHYPHRQPPEHPPDSRAMVRRRAHSPRIWFRGHCASRPQESSRSHAGAKTRWSNCGCRRDVSGLRAVLFRESRTMLFSIHTGYVAGYSGGQGRSRVFGEQHGTRCRWRSHLVLHQWTCRRSDNRLFRIALPSRIRSIGPSLAIGAGRTPMPIRTENGASKPNSSCIARSPGRGLNRWACTTQRPGSASSRSSLRRRKRTARRWKCNGSGIIKE